MILALRLYFYDLVLRVNNRKIEPRRDFVGVKKEFGKNFFCTAGSVLKLCQPILNQKPPIYDWNLHKLFYALDSMNFNFQC